MTLPIPVEIALLASLGLLMAALGIVAIRLLRGPTPVDRLVAMDMLGLVAVGLCAVAALLSGHEAYLDVALGLALVSFLGTVAFAELIEKAAEQKETP